MYLVLSVGKVPVLVYSILGHFILAGVTKPACDHVCLTSHVSVCHRVSEYLGFARSSHISAFSNVVTPARPGRTRVL